MRNCECIGIPSMFQGRVMGVGSIEPGGRSPYDGMFDNIISNYTGRGIDPRPDGGIGKLQVCHPNSPPGTCKPVDWNPLEEAPRDEAPREKLAAKSSGLPIPLLLGAAYLLLA